MFSADRMLQSYTRCHAFTPSHMQAATPIAQLHLHPPSSSVLHARGTELVLSSTLLLLGFEGLTFLLLLALLLFALLGGGSGSGRLLVRLALFRRLALLALGGEERGVNL